MIFFQSSQVFTNTFPGEVSKKFPGKVKRSQAVYSKGITVFWPPKKNSTQLRYDPHEQ